MIASRDYSLTGPDGRRAQEQGLAGAAWYASPIPRKQMKELMRRKDGPAIRDTLIWFAILGALGTLLYQTWGTWRAVPVSSPTAFFTRRAATAAGTNAATVPPSGRPG
jgi:fatty acid desaturase